MHKTVHLHGASECCAQKKKKALPITNIAHKMRPVFPQIILRDKSVLLKLYAWALDVGLSRARTVVCPSEHRETTAHSSAFVYNTRMSECTEGSIINFAFGCYGLPVMTLKKKVKA